MKISTAGEGIKQARSCIACGETVSKRELLRIVRTPDGKVVYDATGRANGRGAYVCRKCECVERACKKHLIEKHLNVSPDENLFEELRGNCK